MINFDIMQSNVVYSECSYLRQKSMALQNPDRKSAANGQWTDGLRLQQQQLLMILVTRSDERQVAVILCCSFLIDRTREGLKLMPMKNHTQKDLDICRRAERDRQTDGQRGETKIQR